MTCFQNFWIEKWRDKYQQYKIEKYKQTFFSYASFEEKLEYWRLQEPFVYRPTHNAMVWSLTGNVMKSSCIPALEMFTWKT